MNRKSKVEVILSSHQDEKRISVMDALKQGRKRVVLQGSAGTGKTTLVNFIIEEFTEMMLSGSIYIAAPTHKALSVLKSKINMEEEKDDPVKFCTLHKGLKLKPFTNEQTGKRSFVQSFRKNDKPFKGCRLLVIDESSMINSDMLKLLEQYDFPIIFIGDEKQVNPVKEIHSPVFHQNWFTVELTEIVRQGEGNPIIELSNNLSSIHTGEQQIIGTGNDRHGYLYNYERQKVIYKLSEVNGTDDLKYIAWTNDEVDAINSSVRANVYGTPALLEADETIVLNRQYVINEDNILYNNQNLLIEELSISNKTIHKGGEAFHYKVYIINDQISALHEDDIFKFRQDCRVVKGMAIKRDITWVEYYEFLETFLDFKYNHAITAHKSQGSTYKDAIVNVGDIMQNFVVEERTRLLYTAVTRASNLLILHNV